MGKWALLEKNSCTIRPVRVPPMRAVRSPPVGAMDGPERASVAGFMAISPYVRSACRRPCFQGWVSSWRMQSYRTSGPVARFRIVKIDMLPSSAGCGDSTENGGLDPSSTNPR